MKPTAIQLDRIRSTVFMQFPGLDILDLVENIDVTVSRKTGRVRGVFDGEERLFSLRTSDGRLLPTFEAGQRILASGYKRNRVVMNADAAPFIARGKSAFCKHVVTVDKGVVPYGEVFLVDEMDDLLAVGTAQQPGYAMLELTSGMAARIKHSRDR